MPKRSSKRQETDPNRLAFLAVQRIIEAGGTSDKNPAAVVLGHLGGIKGGKARAAKLSARRKSDIARKAALARWKKSP
jgi:hypothetical protein